MRMKDDNKRKAISEAAIKLIYRNGFADTSMSKIAKEAGVSPSTIYVYFDNKEDMLNKLYLYSKEKMFGFFYSNIDINDPIKKIARIFFMNMYHFMINDSVVYYFCEQFANSPFINRISREKVNEHYAFALQLIDRGIREGVFIEADPFIISNILVAPLTMYVKSMRDPDLEIEQETVDQLFELSWRAVAK